MRISILFVLIAFTSTVNAQSVNVSSFIGDNPSNTLNLAMHSPNDTLVFDLQGSPYIYEPMRFEKIENKVLILQKGVEIKAKPNAFPKPTDALFKFIDCKNITILGNENVISMNKEEYLDGEWRHVIRLRGCSNITIQNLTLRDSGGDGIAIGGSERNIYSDNIKLNKIYCCNNKRQGMSITSAKNVSVTNCQFAETIGTFPGSGVDIEPNKAFDVISGITFEDCIFRDNFNTGIKIALVNLTSKSTPVDIVFRNCTLINNFSPENPKPPAEIFIRSHKWDAVDGLVLFENCIVRDSQWGFLYAQKRAQGFKVKFVDCKAINICQQKNIPAILLETPRYKVPEDMGGFEFTNLELDYDVDVPPVKIKGLNSGNLEHVRDISGTITVPGSRFLNIQSANYDPSKNIDVNLKIISRSTK